MNFKSSKIRWVMALSFALVITLAIIVTTTSIRGIARADSSASGPTIASDQADYEPGEIVTLKGAGWASGEKVHIYVNDSDVRLLDGSTTPVTDGDEVIIIPAVAGG